MMPNFDEILDGLNTLRDDPDGFTTEEMADETGFSLGTCRKKIRALIKAGRAEFVGKKRVIRMDGQAGLSPAYRVKNEQNNTDIQK